MRLGALIGLVILLIQPVTAAAAEVTLYQVTFPERKSVKLDFSRTKEAPEGTLRASVEHEEGRATVELDFDDMKPAILFGGDVTCFVVWAVSRDGEVENLGELWVRDDDGDVEYGTSMKSFGLFVTGEAYPLVSEPSELVLFTSLKPSSEKIPAEPFTFADLAAAPAHDYPSIARIEWRDDRAVDLEQAQKAYELAERVNASDHAPDLMKQSRVALAQAASLSAKNADSKTAIDYARRSVDMSAEAIRTAERRIEAEQLAAEIEARKAEMAALEARAAEAEQMAETARQQQALAEQASAEADQAREAADASRRTAEAAVAAAQARLVDTERQAENAARRAAELKAEKEALNQRLQGALSAVAETRDSARGFIVNLPDILFDTNEATLKDGAKVVIAKIAGILLVMPELNLRIEGHTDSTGSMEWNQKLSLMRAQSVQLFLQENGLDAERIIAAGYGMERPRADNSTKEGRQKNRRVEIIIAEGVVEEAGADVEAGE
jgi:outer membrane protein OmpA-like peptidoglycan-associated protein